MTAAINDLSIYGIFEVNFPKLVNALEHAKDHVKAELKESKERLEIISNPDIEEDNGAKELIINQYMEKGI